VNVVAIDGPSGSGKSTVARGVARALGLHVLDTGAMYRGVTLAAIEAGVPLDDGDACAAIARNIELAVEDGTTVLGGRDVSEEIRGPDVTRTVSTVAAHPAVRAVLVDYQRDWVRRHGGGVVEGRDIGTVVFPDASLKVFLTASDDERARRRHQEEQAAARDVEVDDVRADLVRRDAVDSGRVASPLRPADDAVVMDTTDSSIDEVVADIVARVRELEAR
jgi:cytidylate kinase